MWTAASGVSCSCRPAEVRGGGPRLRRSSWHIPHSDEAGPDFAMVGAKHFFFNTQRETVVCARGNGRARTNRRSSHQHHLPRSWSSPAVERQSSQGSIIGLEKHQVSSGLRDVDAVLPRLIEGQIAGSDGCAREEIAAPSRRLTVPTPAIYRFQWVGRLRGTPRQAKLASFITQR